MDGWMGGDDAQYVTVAVIGLRRAKGRTGSYWAAHPHNVFWWYSGSCDKLRLVH